MALTEMRLERDLGKFVHNEVEVTPSIIFLAGKILGAELDMSLMWSNAYLWIDEE